MLKTKPNLTLAIALTIGWVSIPCEILADRASFASPINPTIKPYERTMAKADRTAECKAFTAITDKAAGARNTMDLSVAWRYTNDLKQDLLTLKVEDSQLKSLQERYLQFTVDMGEKLQKAKREQAQGDYSALLAAMPTLTATGSRGIDLEQELWQYCGKTESH